MERKKKVKLPEPEVSAKLHWRKVGGGSLRLKNQIIKPNQEFWADLDEIPKAFLSCLVCLDDSKLQAVKAEEKKVATMPEQLFSLKNAGKGLFDVVNANGKPINELPLSEDAAKELKISLEA